MPHYLHHILFDPLSWWERTKLEFEVFVSIAAGALAVLLLYIIALWMEGRDG